MGKEQKEITLAPLEPGEYTGRIVKSTGGLYRIETERGLADCRARGAFRREKRTPLTGDMVKICLSEGQEGVITEILPRRNALIRPAVANVEKLILVAAATSPEPDRYILDKLTAISAFNGIETILVINKCDLKAADDLKRVYTAAGFAVYCVSANEPQAYEVEFEALREALRGHVCFFSGASGVGKSSLLNVLYPGFAVETGEISRKIERGKHTTRVSELFRVEENTYIGDTPGFGMVDVVGFQLLTFEGLLGSFPDIERYAQQCRYTDCTHLCEDGCGVMAALERGEIAPSRHESFVRLYRELKEAGRR